jgi:hypothetical protein
MGSSAVGGDIIQFSTLTRFLNANNNGGMNLTTAAYTGAVLNFYDPDATAGMSVGNPPGLPSKAINAQYWQVAGNGRLEGFGSLADYNQSSNNRLNTASLSDMNAFGGTGLYQSIAAFAVPVHLAPEAASALVWLGMIFSLTTMRRR